MGLYKKREPKPKTCPICNNVFLTSNPNKITCSLSCRNSALIKYREETSGYRTGLPASTTGALSELLVCSDLLSKGYYVFRSLSPNSPYDIVADKNGQIYKIEITTGRRLPSGVLVYSKHDNLKNKFDVIAISIINKREIIYIPELSK
jgi:hypothetical protein